LIDKLNIKTNNVTYTLNPSLDDFESNKVYIISFLKSLWNYPEAIYHILNNSDSNIIQSNLASFIVNNFYCNYLSGNYIENNLLYIITMMLKDEINKLESVNQFDTFLENSKVGFLLEQLRRMPDIQIFFNNVILKTVEKMERESSYKEINLNVSDNFNDFSLLLEIEKKILKKKFNFEEACQKILNEKIIEGCINNNEEKDTKIEIKNKFKELFIQKNLCDINIKEIKNLCENAQKENKSLLFDYFKELENNIISNENKNLYSNTMFMKKLIDTKLNLGSYLLLLYQKDYMAILSYAEQLIEDLMNNILLLPTSIKYICKIISILIKNKFKNITKTDENAFISKFIIGKLLIPIISSPTHNAYISDFIISKNTIKNISQLNIILKRLFSGKLFNDNLEEAEYTPFNRLFLDKIEKILYFYEKAINVNLPDFIENYINDRLPSDYLYDFYNENKGEIYTKISICFTIDNLFNLIKGLEKSEAFFQINNNKVKKLKKSFEKLKSEKNINEIIKTDNQKKEHHRLHKKDEKNDINDKKKEKEKENEIINYYLYNDETIEKKYDNLFTINNTIANFYINIKKLEKNQKLDEKDKNLIKIKNYLCSSLGTFRLLNQSDFNNESTSNLKKMLNEIKSYMSLPNYILGNSTIPTIWYINSILEYLDKIPQDYINNNYIKLFSELTQNLKDSINSLDFETLILFRNKLKFIDKINNYYDSLKQLINIIRINENIKNIVANAFIPIDLSFNYDKKDKKFDLMKSNLKEKAFESNIISKKKLTSFKTIEAFARNFPNLKKYGVNPLIIIRELLIGNKINKYLKMIEEDLAPSIPNQYEKIYIEKINDYIMNKIYDKIYPSQYDYKDIKISNKTLSLSWVEPNLLLNKDYIFDNMLPDILNEFNQINIIKSPFQKLRSFRKIMKYIDNLIQFNEGIDKEIGAEDIIPVLNYVFIKAVPQGISTDIEFVKEFLDNNGKFENSLVSLESMCDVILNCNATNFNLTDEEFKKRCGEYGESDKEIINQK